MHLRALIAVLFLSIGIAAQPFWQRSLDGEVRFYQTTDFGIIVAGTDKSAYAIDAKTGEQVWRRSHRGLDETSVTPVPATDMILVSSDLGDKSRVEAVDLLTGATLWQSEKMKGDVSQLAVDPQSDLIALILIKKAWAEAGDDLEREPVIHMLRLSTGDEIWKRDLGSDVRLMPSRFGSDGKVPFTLDNYRPPLFLDGRLYLFYEGVSSYDARTGKDGEREKFTVNEGGLALTEADPVIDEQFIFTSGKGRVRAINRTTFEEEWKAADLGTTPEMMLAGEILYVRTGGQFTKVKNGETETKGPFGISALNRSTGKTVWRFKGADKGLTNVVFPDANRIVVADRDDLFIIDSMTGKKLGEVEHKVAGAQFVILNEAGQAIVGGKEELAAFDIAKLTPQNPKPKIQNIQVWRAKHTPPARGLLRVIAGVALRATALYFRYGGIASTAFSAFRGVSAARSALSLRWSGLSRNFASLDLTTLASNAARSYVSERITVFGIASRLQGVTKIGGMNVLDPGAVRGSALRMAADRFTPKRGDVLESLFDRLDPAKQAERLSNYLLRRERLARLRGSHMYFFTDIPKPFDRKGLVGVNIHTGKGSRFVLTSDPDPRFTTDEVSGLLYSADGGKLEAYELMGN